MGFCCGVGASFPGVSSGCLGILKIILTTGLEFVSRFSLHLSGGFEM
jgi:hypothetical protein